MQESTSDPLDLNKRQMQDGQYYTPPPSDGGMREQVHE